MNKSMILVSAIASVLFVSPVLASDNEHEGGSTTVSSNPTSLTNNTTLNSALTNNVTNSVTNSSVIDNVNRNRNDNVNNLNQNQGQWQDQAQHQDQNQSATSTSNASATGGAGGAGGNANATGGNATASGGAGGNATASGNGSGNVTTINQNYRDYRAPVNSAHATNLTSGIDTCLGSVAGAVQTQIIGLSGGKTVVDQNCVMIKQVHLLADLGYPTAACFRARQDEQIDAAMKTAHIDCSLLPLPEAAVVPVVPVVEQKKEVYVTKQELVEHEERIVKSVLSK